MTTRQVLLLGGAALVLAACADSTAPGTNMRRAGVEASAKKDSTTTTVRTMSTESLSECRGGYSVAVGRTDSTCVSDEIQ
jgi:hypothetical protein